MYIYISIQYGKRFAGEPLARKKASYTSFLFIFTIYIRINLVVLGGGDDIFLQARNGLEYFFKPL